MEPVADVRGFSLAPRRFTTACGGLFLFVPDLVRLNLDGAIQDARLPGSKMIPAGQAARAALALKLWSIERKSHVMALLADDGFGLFAGLNVFPQEELSLRVPSSRIDHLKPCACWPPGMPTSAASQSFPGSPSIWIFTRCPTTESIRPSRSTSSPCAAGASRACSSSSPRMPTPTRSAMRMPISGRATSPMRSSASSTFWKRTHGTLPPHLVFDSKLTTHRGLARMDGSADSTFITLRRRSSTLLEEIVLLPRSAWRTVELDVPTRKYRTPRYVEQAVTLAGRRFRQLYVQDLGHEDPTILLTNESRTSPKALITRYAQRMLIENALSDAVRFFHMDALSSAVGLKVDFDMTLLVVASGLYRLLAGRMRGYHDAQARQIFRDLVAMPATVRITNDDVEVSFHRRSHLPIVMASGLMDHPVAVPWWGGRRLRLTTYNGPTETASA